MPKKQQQQPLIELTLEQKSQQFFEHVDNGRQKAAAELLQSLNENEREFLLAAKHDITDQVGRTFKGITAFQNAVWKLDYLMWEMLLKYLSPDKAAQQIQEMSRFSWVAQYGSHADWTSLSTTLMNHANNATLLNTDNALASANVNPLTTTFINEVGRQQCSLPMHVIQTFCTPGENWWSRHLFLSDNTRYEGIVTKVHNFSRPDRYANWYQNYDQILFGRKRYLGDNMAYFRGDKGCPRWKSSNSVKPSYIFHTTGEGGVRETHTMPAGDYFKLLAIDANAFSALYTLRKGQYDELMNKLTVSARASSALGLTKSASK